MSDEQSQDHAELNQRIAQAGNTAVPALLAIESLGFEVELGEASIVARRGEERYVADDSVTLLGLIRLVELRSWNWSATDSQIDEALRRFDL